MVTTVTGPLATLGTRHFIPIQSSFDWDAVAREQISYTTAATSVTELEQLISQLPSNRHLMVLEGFLERWREKSEEFVELPTSLQSAFEEIPTNRSIRVIIESFISQFDPRGLGEVSKQDISWICNRVVRQAEDAAVPAQIAGPSVHATDLSYRLDRTLRDVILMIEQGKILSYKAFEWYWVPEWQLLKGENNDYVIPIVSSIIERNNGKRQLNTSDIMYWAMQPCETLEGHSPAWWLQERREQSSVLVSLDRFVPRASCSPGLVNTTITINEKGSQHKGRYRDSPVNGELDQIRVRKINRLLAEFGDSIIIEEVMKFIRAISLSTNFPHPMLETEDDLLIAGRSFVDHHFIAYPYYATLYLELLKADIIRAPVSLSTSKWLGIAMARKVREQAILIDVVGPRLDKIEVVELLGLTEEALLSLEHSSRLISFRSYDYHWFPRWQFNIAERKIRPVAMELIEKLKEETGFLGPYEIASWATTSEWDRLLGNTPAQWIEDPSQDTNLVLKAASDFIRDLDV